jgi:hypothetical protein
LQRRYVSQRPTKGQNVLENKPMDSPRFFEVLPAGEMRRKYGLFAENRPTITLNPAAVPPVLQHLIPLAEQFGVGDDLIRTDIIKKTPAADIVAMQLAVEAHADAFDEWLAGPESSGPKFSPEYIAFSCLRLAADGI